MNIVDIINKKRVGKTLTYEELKYVFLGYLNNKIEMRDWIWDVLIEKLVR